MNDNYDLITIIMPIRNEINFITKTLDAVANQTYPKNSIQLIISDGMSDDGTRDVIKNYSKHNDKILLIDNPERIVSTGFNRALNHALGSIIIRVDGHCIIDKDYVMNCVTVIRKINADCVGGYIINHNDNFIGKVINIGQSSSFGVGNVSFRKNQEKGKYVDTLAFGAYKRNVFLKIGGYDKELIRNQDDEFNFRLIQNGGKIWLDSKIKSHYFPRNTLRKLFLQYFQYGFYKIRVIQKRKNFSSWRHLIPASFCIGIILTIFLYAAYGIELPLFALWFIYFTVNIFFTGHSVYKKFKSDPVKRNWFLLIKTFFTLPVVFLTFHISYGSGFLLGFIYYFRNWNDVNIDDALFNRDRFKSYLK